MCKPLQDTGVFKKRDELLAFFNVSSGIELSLIKQKLVDLDQKTFQSLLDYLLKRGDELLALQLIYYFTLFRDDEAIADLFRTNRMPLQFIEYMIVTLLSRDHEETDQLVLDTLMLSLSQENYLDLLLNSKLINQDANLLFYLLTKLDCKHIDQYFNTVVNLDNVLKKLLVLDKSIIRYIFINNTDLYGFLTLFIEVSQDEEIKMIKTELYDKIEEIQQTKLMIMNVSSRFNIEEERNLALSDRNKERFAYIIRQVQNHENHLELLSAMTREGVIIDDTEEGLILEIINNPLFSNILRKYSLSTERAV